MRENMKYDTNVYQLRESVLKRIRGSLASIFRRIVCWPASGCSGETQKSRSSVSMMRELHLSMAGCSAFTIATSSFSSSTRLQALIEPNS